MLQQYIYTAIYIQPLKFYSDQQLANQLIFKTSDRRWWHVTSRLLLLSAQRCCAIHCRSTMLRPRHWHTRQFPLVGWRSRSVFSSSWRQSPIVHWTVRLLATWLQIYAVCLIFRPDYVWDRHSLTSSMSVSRSVLLLETELSLWLVLDYGTVCHMTSSPVTHCHISVVDSKHFNLDSHILLFCFSFFLVVLAVFTRATLC